MAVVWRALLAIVSIASQAAPDPISVKNREVSLARAMEMFGPRVPHADVVLFEANHSYAVELTLAKDGHITAATIRRKDTFWDHAEWRNLDLAHQYLSSEVLAELLKKLDHLRPFGRLVRPDGEKVKMVTNSTAYYTDEYEHAAVTRGQLAGVLAPDPPRPPLFRLLQVEWRILRTP